MECGLRDETGSRNDHQEASPSSRLGMMRARAEALAATAGIGRVVGGDEKDMSIILR